MSFSLSVIKGRQLGFIIVIAVGLHSVCSSNPVNSLPSKSVVVMLDMSESTNKSEVREKYSEEFKKILGHLDHGDAITAGLITGKSITEMVFPIREEFPSFVHSMSTNIYRDAERKKADQELEKRKNELAGILDQTIKDDIRKIMNTDIMSSLQVAERVFDPQRQGRRYLVIFSDMLEDSADYNFEQENLTNARIGAIISKEKQRGRIPDLNNVQVFIVGPFASSLERFYGVQDFWLCYFKECGAILSKKDYGTSLLKFD